MSRISARSTKLRKYPVVELGELRVSPYRLCYLRSTLSSHWWRTFAAGERESTSGCAPAMGTNRSSRAWDFGKDLARDSGPLPRSSLGSRSDERQFSQATSTWEAPSGCSAHFQQSLGSISHGLLTRKYPGEPSSAEGSEGLRARTGPRNTHERALLTNLSSSVTVTCRTDTF